MARMDKSRNLKLLGQPFYIFKAMPKMARVQTLLSPRKKIASLPAYFCGQGASVHRPCLQRSAKELSWLVFLEEIRLVSSS